MAEICIFFVSILQNVSFNVNFPRIWITLGWKRGRWLFKLVFSGSSDVCVTLWDCDSLPPTQHKYNCGSSPSNSNGAMVQVYREKKKRRSASQRDNYLQLMKLWMAQAAVWREGAQVRTASGLAVVQSSRRERLVGFNWVLLQWQRQISVCSLDVLFSLRRWSRKKESHYFFFHVLWSFRPHIMFDKLPLTHILWIDSVVWRDFCCPGFQFQLHTRICGRKSDGPVSWICSWGSFQIAPCEIALWNEMNFWLFHLNFQNFYPTFPFLWLACWKMGIFFISRPLVALM